MALVWAYGHTGVVMRRLPLSVACLPLPFLAFAFPMGQMGTKSLLDGAQIKPTSSETTAVKEGSGVKVKIAPGENGYPGVGFALGSDGWDLSKFGHVEARLVNTGPKPITLSLRVDNAGSWQDNPWNTESVTLQPGEKGAVKTIFGYQYGMKKGFKLDPAKVVNVMVFTTKADAAQSFRIESLVAGGLAGETPPIAPEDVRIKPENGVIFDPKAKIGKLAITFGNIERASTGQLTVAGNGVLARFRPQEGRWDLREASGIRLTVRNAGDSPVAPKAMVETNGGPSPWSVLAKPLKPGATGDIVVPFGHPINLGDSNTAVKVASDAVGEIVLANDGDAKLELVSIRTVDAPAKLPDWLGKRPPVPGEWTKTLDDEFDGTRLDPTVWKVTGENYYDKQTHWSKENVIVKDGMARLRYEKKAGFQNDDPKRNQTAYASGYLDTFGLWAQRYGYFEARMKLPKAPGLWPAFWMMPDRGSKEGPEQWKRQDTANGGMEFDIMEHLTRWGGHRTNIAMHYDGYGADHKMPGSDKVYVQPDKDGFITCGLLWTPGEAVYYANGVEVLRWKNPRISNVPSILMFTLPSGGWDNDALDDDRLPADFTIDYVRVWQRKDLAAPEDGKRNDPQK